MCPPLVFGAQKKPGLDRVKSTFVLLCSGCSTFLPLCPGFTTSESFFALVLAPVCEGL